MYLYLKFQLSGLLSCLIDSIPVTAMMIKIVLLIAEDESIQLPMQPLVWAVAFGPCLGGTSYDKLRHLSLSSRGKIYRKSHINLNINVK